MKNENEMTALVARNSAAFEAPTARTVIKVDGVEINSPTFIALYPIYVMALDRRYEIELECELDTEDYQDTDWQAGMPQEWHDLGYIGDNIEKTLFGESCEESAAKYHRAKK